MYWQTSAIQISILNAHREPAKFQQKGINSAKCLCYENRVPVVEAKQETPNKI